MSFLTLEDINGTLFSNQGFYWHEIDTSEITTGTEDFSNVKYDFCTVSRSYHNGYYDYTCVIDADNWTKGFYALTPDYYFAAGRLNENTLTIREYTSNGNSIRLFLYMGSFAHETLTQYNKILVDDTINLNYKELHTTQSINIKYVQVGTLTRVNVTLTTGYNDILHYNEHCGFLLVNLVKTDFQFNCTQSLTVGKVNTVSLGALSDYKLNGDMIGDNTPSISIIYESETIPASWNEELNDYAFDLDLTDRTEEGVIKLKVLVDSNDVLNATETDILLNASFETINNQSKLQTLFQNGGIGRLSADITLTTDLTADTDVAIFGNNHTLNLNTHKFIVEENNTFKAENTSFTNGENTIQQNINTKVELVDCDFTDCIGIGSVIDCQVDIESLNNPTDFTTILTGCTISNCDMAVLSGGELTVTDCTVIGKIGNYDLPFFLYQTDGNATITQSNFSITNNTQITEDIKFNPCLFICGETATINDLTHSDLQKNEIISFIKTPIGNTSIIDLTYYYDLIEDYISIQSENGYCYGVSGVDYVFKTNANIRRVE